MGIHLSPCVITRHKKTITTLKPIMKREKASKASSKAKRMITKVNYQARSSPLVKFLATRSITSFAIAGVFIGLVCWTFISLQPSSRRTRLRKRDLTGSNAFDLAAQEVPDTVIDLASLRGDDTKMSDDSSATEGGSDSNEVGTDGLSESSSSNISPTPHSC